MHALTVQYYEVVQIYRTEARLHHADRCFFLPMKVLDFTGENGQTYVDRFRGALRRAALTPRIASLLADDTTSVIISPHVSVVFSGLDPRLLFVPTTVRAGLAVQTPFIQPAKPAGPTSHIEREAAITATESLVHSGTTTLMTRNASASSEFAKVRLWDETLVANVSNIISRPLFRPGSDALHVPDETILLSITFTDVGLRGVRLQRTSEDSAQTLSVSDNGEVTLPTPVPLIDLAAIDLAKTETSSASGSMLLVCSYLGRHFTLPAIPVDLEKGTAFQRVVTLANDRADRRKEILTHLQNHRDYYSQAIHQALDSTTMMLLLSNYHYEGRPLSEIVEPTPVKIAGNYLILRAPVDVGEQSGLQQDGEPATWGDYLEARGLALEQPADQRLIPIPTGGVFAEAVLGRSNAAEKLDITRFWNWQDSPIPLSPTEIQPVGTGSRATDENLMPGQLGQPVLNIVNPTSLPDPAGLGAGFGALANGNMFRDMSGQAGTQGLVQHAMTASQQAATNAGQIASANLRTEAQKSVAMGQIAADIVKSLLGQGGGGGSGQGVSAEGAKINHGQSMDLRGVGNENDSGAGSANGTTSGSITGHSGEGNVSTSGTVREPSRDGNSGGSSFEAGAFNAATHGIDPGITGAVIGSTEALVDSGTPALGAGSYTHALWGIDGQDGMTGLFQTVRDGTSLDKQNYVYIHGLSTSGKSQVINTPLGVNPGGAFNNAVDISARNSLSGLQQEQPELIWHTRFRWRQTASQTGFEKIGKTWKQVYHSIGSLPDDPDPQLQTAQDIRGWIRMFDSPGWPSLVGPTIKNLALGGGIKSSDKAVEVVVKMFLQTWVEGLDRSGTWERVSGTLEWCSIQWLKRTSLSAPWKPTPGSKVVSGGSAWAEFVTSPEDKDIHL